VCACTKAETSLSARILSVIPNHPSKSRSKASLNALYESIDFTLYSPAAKMVAFHVKRDRTAPQTQKAFFFPLRKL
jgi:hypothetical protein